MKRKNLLFSVFTFPFLLLTSCQEIKLNADHLDDYVKTMEYHEGFNILQLTDIHWSSGTDASDSKEYVDKVINEAKRYSGNIDLIEITGDSFMLSNMQTALSFLDYFQALNIPFATVWGNHDEEGTYSANWLSEQFLNAKNSLYTEVDNDDVYERSNYIINLTQNGSTKWQLTHLDSGALYNENAMDLMRTYDFLRDNQADWMEREHEKVGKDVPMLAFYHIPQQENDIAYDDVVNKHADYKNKFIKNEEFGSSTSEKAKETHFFESAKRSNMKGAFMGHAHSNDWTVDYQGVTLSLGVKTGKELYYTKASLKQAKEMGIDEEFDVVGASLITLHDSGNFDLQHLYLNEREDGDFVKWVKY